MLITPNNDEMFYKRTTHLIKDGFMIGFLRSGQCVWSPPSSGQLNAQMRGYYPSWNKWATASFLSCERCLAARLSEEPSVCTWQKTHTLSELNTTSVYTGVTDTALRHP